MLRIAIVGVGNISRLHFAGYLSFPERCEIVALADILPERAAAAAERHNLKNAKTFSSHTDMLAAMADEIDLVSVCTPPYAHAQIAIDSMHAGCNVLGEKPMAASLEECDAMLAAEKETGKTLSIIAQNRFRKPILAIKALLDEGLIGRVLHAQIDSYWWRGSRYYDLWWRGRWDKEGGGCTLNHAVHHIDMLLWMMGTPEKVTSVISNAGHDNAEVEDISVSVLQYPKGSLAQITGSVIHHGEEQQIIFQGEKARISAPWKLATSVQKPNGFGEPNPELEKQIEEFVKALPTPDYESHTGQIDNVLTALETGTRPLIGGVNGRATIELITAIYKSGSTESTVKFPLSKDDPFYTVDGILANTPRFYEKTTALESLVSDPSQGSDYKMKL